MAKEWNRPYEGPPEPDLPLKCKFCGASLSASSYPKFSGSDTVNHMCTTRKCGAHYYGKRPGPYKWWTKQEWEEWING